MQPYKAPPAGDEAEDETDLRLQDLQGIEWVVEDINGSAVLEDSTVTLHFGVDAKVSGKASCNSYNAGYTLDDEKLKIANAISTKMACAPELMDQERDFLDILTNATSLHLDEDGALVIEASGGRALTARSE
jgi:putative lipoprotein